MEWKINSWRSVLIIGFLVILSFLILLSEGVAQEKVLKFGAALSLTGGAARQGTRDKESYSFWRDVVNERGGINVAGTKYKIEIIFYDDKSDPATCAKLVEKLITEDKVNFILGPYGSGATFAASSVSEKYEIPMMSFSSAPSIFARGYKYVFAVTKCGDTYSDATFPFVFDIFKNKPNKDIKVAIATQNSTAMLPIGDHARDNANNFRTQLVYDDKFASGTKDFTPILLELKAKKPDFFFISGYPNESIQIIKQMKDMNIIFPVVSVAFGQSNEDWRRSLGDAAYGIAGEMEWTETLKAKCPIMGSPKEFVELWKKKKNYEPDFENALGVGAAVVYQLAIQKAGTIDSKIVRDFISNFNEETFIGRVKFRPTGARANPLIIIQQVVSKDPGPNPPVVWPPEMATHKPIFPLPPWDKR